MLECPSVIVVFGLPGSGKSFFAKHLAATLKAHYVSSDEVRNSYFETKDYSLKGKERVYRIMNKLIKDALAANKCVVVDATFYLKKWRRMLSESVDNSVPLYYIEVYASNGLIKQRTSQKRLTSDADYNIYKEISNAFQPMLTPHLFLESTDNNVDTMTNTAMDYLQIKEVS